VLRCRNAGALLSNIIVFGLGWALFGSGQRTLKTARDEWKFTASIYHKGLPVNSGRLFAGIILRKILDCTGGDIYGKRGARPYNGGLGAEPPAGSRGIPWSGGFAPPPEADSILAFER